MKMGSILTWSGGVMAIVVPCSSVHALWFGA